MVRNEDPSKLGIIEQGWLDRLRIAEEDLTEEAVAATKDNTNDLVVNQQATSDVVNSQNETEETEDITLSLNSASSSISTNRSVTIIANTRNNTPANRDYDVRVFITDTDNNIVASEIKLLLETEDVLTYNLTINRAVISGELFKIEFKEARTGGYIKLGYTDEIFAS